MFAIINIQTGRIFKSGLTFDEADTIMDNMEWQAKRLAKYFGICQYNTAERVWNWVNI